MVNPYGNAGAASDPETVATNYQTHPHQHVRLANADDLEGMVREPSGMPEAGEACGVASTDDMELKVLRPSVLSLAAAPGLRVEAHSTIATMPDPPVPPQPLAAQCLQDAATMTGLIAEAYRRRRTAASVPASRGLSQNGAHALPAMLPAAHGSAPQRSGSMHMHDTKRSGELLHHVSALTRRRNLMYALPSGGALGPSRCYRVVHAEEVHPSTGRGHVRAGNV